MAVSSQKKSIFLCCRRIRNHFWMRGRGANNLVCVSDNEMTSRVQLVDNDWSILHQYVFGKNQVGCQSKNNNSFQIPQGSTSCPGHCPFLQVLFFILSYMCVIIDVMQVGTIDIRIRYTSTTVYTIGTPPSHWNENTLYDL